MQIEDNIRGESGVYCIECLKDNRIYIGSSYDVKNRIGAHISALRGSYHPNNLLLEAFDNYGESSFRAYILEYTDINIQFKTEQLYLDIFLYAQEYIDSKWNDYRFHKYGFNIKPSVNDMRGYTYSHKPKKQSQISIDKRNKTLRILWQQEEFVERVTAFRKTDEFREKLRIANANSEKAKKLKTHILVYDMHTGYFIEEIVGLRQCARKFNTHRSNISKVLKGVRRYIKDKHLVKKKSEDFPLKITPIPKYKDYDNWLKRVSEKPVSIIVQIDKEGNVVAEHKGEVAAALSLGRKNIQSNINREMKKDHYCHGYFWWKKRDMDELGIDFIRKKIKYHLTIKHILAYNRHTLLFIEEFDGIYLAAEKYGLNRGAISNNLSGRTGYCGDYIFKKKTENYPLKLE